METAMEKRVEEQKKSLKKFEEKSQEEFQRRLRQHQVDLKKKEEIHPHAGKSNSYGQVFIPKVINLN